MEEVVEQKLCQDAKDILQWPCSLFHRNQNSEMFWTLIFKQMKNCWHILRNDLNSNE